MLRRLRGRETGLWLGTHGIAVTQSGRKILVPADDLGVVPSIAVYGIWEPPVEAASLSLPLTSMPAAGTCRRVA